MKAAQKEIDVWLKENKMKSILNVFKLGLKGGNRSTQGGGSVLNKDSSDSKAPKQKAGLSLIQKSSKNGKSSKKNRKTKKSKKSH